MDELRALVRDLATRPSAENADVFVAELAAVPASAELTAFITETLELSALHQVSDSSGKTVRWHLIDRLLALGFPHALHVSPDDLDYHRDRIGNAGAIPAALTTVASLLTMFWSFGFALLAGFAAFSSYEPSLKVGAVGMGLAGIHAVLAFVNSIRVGRGEPAPLMPWLGWAFMLGPVVAAIAELTERRGGTVAIVLGAPAMLTALLCALTAAMVGTRAKPAPTQARVDALEAQATPHGARVDVRG